MRPYEHGHDAGGKLRRRLRELPNPRHTDSSRLRFATEFRKAAPLFCGNGRVAGAISAATSLIRPLDDLYESHGRIALFFVALEV
jgi:hypothetical protein